MRLSKDLSVPSLGKVILKGLMRRPAPAHYELCVWGEAVFSSLQPPQAALGEGEGKPWPVPCPSPSPFVTSPGDTSPRAQVAARRGCEGVHPLCQLTGPLLLVAEEILQLPQPRAAGRDKLWWPLLF